MLVSKWFVLVGKSICCCLCVPMTFLLLLSIETFSRNNFSHSFFCQQTGVLKAHKRRCPTYYGPNIFDILENQEDYSY